MSANYEQTDLQPILPFAPTEDDAPFPWQASTSTDHVLYLANDRGIWLRVPDNDITGSEFEALTGFRLEELKRKKEGNLYIYTLKNGEPLLPFPFTATQLRELDQRTGGVFSERISCQFGDKDEEGAKETAALIAEIAQSHPKAAELARAVIYGELPPEQTASTAREESSASDAPAKKWTAEKLAELKAYRSANTMPETAKKFGISEQRIRQLLPSNKPKSRGYSAFTSQMK